MSKVASDKINHINDLLGKYEIKSVGVIDDDYRALEDIEVNPDDAAALYLAIQNDPIAKNELYTLDSKITDPKNITGKFASKFIARRNEFPALDTIWTSSILGLSLDQRTTLLDTITEYLEKNLNLHVQKLTPEDAITDFSIKIYFLDWHMDGTEAADPIAKAISKAQEIYKAYETNKVVKPLVVLMSSRSGVVSEKEEFRKKSGLIGGMFYAIHKSDLYDPFKLVMNMQLFAMSFPVGYQVQRLIDNISDKVKNIGDTFITNISELTVGDYSFIKTLSLQEEGEPLGNYMFWLFGGYFNYLLFDNALRDIRDEMNRLTFDYALPFQSTPSYQLAQIYERARFDLEVGEVGPHPELSDEESDPYINLGDVFLKLELRAPEEAPAPAPEVEPAPEEAPAPAPEEAPATEVEPATGEVVGRIEESVTMKGQAVKSSFKTKDPNDTPKLYMIINNECDLTFTAGGKRRIDREQAVLMIEGSLQQINIGEKPGQRFDLYTFKNQAYRIIWDPKRVKSVQYGKFNEWRKNEQFGRAAKLRLPYALEVQRIFASDLTRIGLPVDPPIYRPIKVELWQKNGNDFELVPLQDSETGGIIDIKKGEKFKFTLPLLSKIREVYTARFNTKIDGSQTPDIKSFLEDFEKWSKLWMDHHDIPTLGKTKALMKPDWLLPLGIRVDSAEIEKLKRQKSVLYVNIEHYNQ